MRKLFRVSGVLAFLLLWMVVMNFGLELISDPTFTAIFATQPADEEMMDEERVFDPELVDMGRQIFEFTAGGIGCAACHGTYALGDTGTAPNLRGADAERLQGGLDVVEEMDFLVNQITTDDITALEEYLAYLATLTPAKSTRVRGSIFEPPELELPVLTDVQLIVQNSDRTTCTLIFSDELFETTPIGGRGKYQDFVWTTGEEPVTYTANCEEVPEQILTVNVVVPEPMDEEGEGE